MFNNIILDYIYENYFDKNNNYFDIHQLKDEIISFAKKMNKQKLLNIINYFINENFDSNTLIQICEFADMIPIDITDYLLKNNIIRDKLDSILCNEEDFMSSSYLRLAEKYFKENGNNESYDEESFYNDSLKSYLVLISKYKVLTKDEELELFNLYKKGNKEAKEALINSNLKLVVNFAKRKLGLGLEFLDLIQEGNIGLIKAIESFDPTLGFRFSTYATPKINSFMQRAIENKSRNIRIPSHIDFEIKKYKKCCDVLLEKLHREPTLEEISEELNISIDKIKEFRRIFLLETISLDEKIPNAKVDDNKLTYYSLVKSENFTEKEFFKKNDASTLYYVIENAGLTEREKQIIIYRFGLLNVKNYSLKQLADKYNISGERIRILEIKALKKLREKYETLDKIQKPVYIDEETEKKDITLREKQEIERKKAFLNVYSLQKFSEDSKFLFKDNTSMYYWFLKNKKEIFSSKKYLDKKITEQYNEYLSEIKENVKIKKIGE